jgi:carboxymethylenebutenolidase
MSNNEAQKFPPEVWKLFDKYVHGAISRREFIDGASAFAVAGLSGAAILEALNPKFAEAQQIAPTDARIKTEYVEIPAPGYGKLRGYLVKPASAKGKLPTVLVVHENRGLNPHIEDVARRVALENFIAFAPDALFPLGGYPFTPADFNAASDAGHAALMRSSVSANCSNNGALILPASSGAGGVP